MVDQRQGVDAARAERIECYGEIKQPAFLSTRTPFERNGPSMTAFWNQTRVNPIEALRTE
jgi:hypothetical protein